MTHKYPYNSQLKTKLSNLREGIDYALWLGDTSVAERLRSLKGPVIEIGGPTDRGFYFLDNIELHSRPNITNISSNPVLHGDNVSELAEQVDDLMDATKMPYADSSVDVFLMSAMSRSSDWWVELNDEEKEKVRSQFTDEFEIARLEMGQVAAGILGADEVKQAQRIKIYLEVNRCLAKGGLFFADGGIDDIVILQKLGFELVACLELAEDYGVSYEFVMAN